jgi:hypothetical protein
MCQRVFEHRRLPLAASATSTTGPRGQAGAGAFGQPRSGLLRAQPRDVGPHPHLLSKCLPVRTGTPSGSSAIPTFHRPDAYTKWRLVPAALELTHRRARRRCNEGLLRQHAHRWRPRKQNDGSAVVVKVPDCSAHLNRTSHPTPIRAVIAHRLARPSLPEAAAAV